MTAGVLGALSAAAAVALMVLPMARPAVHRLQPTAGPQVRAGRRRLSAGAGVVVALVVLGFLAGGLAGGVLVLVAESIVGTIGTLARGRRREKQRGRAEMDAARACALLAAEVRAGRPPESAVEVVSRDCPIFEPAAAALLVGDDPVRAWREQGARPGQGGLADLARAWEVSRACGAPMGPSLDQVAQALDREAEVARTVRSELASAQATGRLMAALPLVGIGLGYGIGGQPIDFLVTTRLGLACTLLATLLACAGALWTEALSRTPGRKE